MGTDPTLYPHIWTEGDVKPGLMLTFHDLQLITDGLVVRACIERPSDVLEKTLTNLDEQRARLDWISTDLQAGINQTATFYYLDGSGNRTTIGQILIDVREKACS